MEQILIISLSTIVTAVRPQMISPLKKLNCNGFHTITGKPTPHIVNPNTKDDYDFEVSISSSIFSLSAPLISLSLFLSPPFLFLCLCISVCGCN